MEPTPGAGCLWEVLGEHVDLESFLEVYSTAYNREIDYLDVLVWERGGIEAFFKSYVGLDCLELIDLRIRGCESEALSLLKGYAEWPEVSRIIMEGDCIELVVPPDPPVRVVEALRKLGYRGKISAKAYRPSELW